MPAIRLFGRRTILGGDDLHPAAFLGVCLRAFQVAAFLVPIACHVWYESSKVPGGLLGYVSRGVPPPDDDSDDDYTSSPCHGTRRFCALLVAYAVASAAYVAAAAVLEWKIAKRSSVGTPTDREPRSSNVARLLELKLVPYAAALFAVWVVGMAATPLAPDYQRCLQQRRSTSNPYSYSSSSNDGDSVSSHSGLHVLWIALGLLLATQFGEVFVTWAFLIQHCGQPRDGGGGAAGANSRHALLSEAQGVSPSSSEEDGDGDEGGDGSHAAAANNNNNHELAEEMWADRCASVCSFLSVATCFMFGGHELSMGAEFGDVARAMADYLETRGVLDVVPSDVIMGLAVLQRLQRWRIRQARRGLLLGGGGGALASVSSASLDSMVAMNEADAAAAANGNGGAVITNATENGALPSLDAPAGATASAAPPSSSGAPMSLRQQFAARNPPAPSSRSGMSNSVLAAGLSNRSLLSRHDVGDMQVLEEGARYAKHALAIYTWVLYLYVHPVAGVPRLLFKSSLFSKYAYCDNRGGGSCPAGSGDTPSPPPAPVSGEVPSRQDEGISSNDVAAGGSPPPALPSPMMPLSPGSHRRSGIRPIVEGDDSVCQFHKSALLLAAGLREADLVYLQLKSSFSENPYCILLDHEWKSVVVSIRGTFSLEDCVTDVLIDPESLEPLGREFGFDATNQFCHGGVLACVRNVYRDLQRHRLLESLLVGPGALYPDYALRLVGHSLGGATCTVLSYMLRPVFPNLRCINYSPPGCTLTWEMATGCQDWCTAFVLDSDLVPRLSRESMEHLRDEILELIGRVRIPKIEVAQRLMDINGGVDIGIVMDEVLYPPDEVPDSDYRRQLEQFKAIQRERRAARGAVRKIQLYPPGRMVHLVKTREQRSCMSNFAKCITCCTTNLGFQYVPVWLQNDELNEIVVTPTMGTDHFPDRIQFMLERVADEFGLSTS